MPLENTSYTVAAEGYIWNTSTLEWEKATASAASGAVTIADGADVCEGAVGDAIVAAGAVGTISAKLRRLTSDIGALLTAAAGFATAAKQDTGNTSLASIDGKITAVNTGAVTISAALPAGNNNIGDVDVASSALPTGAATETTLAAAADSLSVLDDWDETDRAKVNPIAGQAGVQGNTGTVSANTQRVVLATDVALPAGTNAIGKLAANSGVDIGDVDVTSAVTGTLDHGANRDIDASAEQITSTSFACKFGLLLRADRTNTGLLYVGNSDVTAGTDGATDGFPLAAGEAMFFPCSNSNVPYAIGSAANQIIYWFAT